tara:strand:+ start:300 stop:698 length:399 start_codon:yes stop_codon:yes gene_type:complete
MSRIIAVKIGHLPHGYQPILDYYNTNRPEGTQMLEKLNRCEGGFQIKLDNYDEIEDSDINNKIRQLRWCRRKLVSDMYIGFTDKQLDLLYKAIESSFGKENVEFVDETTRDSIPRTYHVKVDNEKHYLRAMY